MVLIIVQIMMENIVGQIYWVIYLFDDNKL